MAKSTSKRPSLQKSVTIPPSEWPDIAEGMKIDGVDNFSVYALAAVRQRTRRLKLQRQLEEEALRQQFGQPPRPSA